MKPTVFHAPNHVRTRDALRKVMGVKGRAVGSGAYAHVYNTSKNARCVVKIGDLDDPYLDYVRFVIRSRPSTLFPRIVDVVYCLESGYPPEMAVEDQEGSYAVVMERLHSSSTTRKENIRELLCGIVDENGWGEYDLEPADAIKTIVRNRISLEELRKMLKLCDWIRDLADKHGHDLDFHDNNIMFRKNGDLVITDPFC